MTYTPGVEDKTVPPNNQAHLVEAGHIWNSSVLSGQEVLHLVDGVVLDIDGADQQVVGDVVQVTTKFQPGPGGTDVVRGAFSLHLERAGGDMEDCISLN